jgi:hypothetical protein
MRNICMDWWALVTSGVLILLLGIIIGMWLLRIELRRNGWAVRLQVDKKENEGR